MSDILLTEKDLAARFKVTTRTLKYWRAAGRMPESIDLGGNTIRYRLDDVRAYEARHTTGGAIPLDARRAMQRAADVLNIITTWAIDPGARDKIGAVRDELTELVSRPADKLKAAE